MKQLSTQVALLVCLCLSGFFENISHCLHPLAPAWFAPIRAQLDRIERGLNIVS
jgi:hypothetical protein